MLLGSINGANSKAVFPHKLRIELLSDNADYQHAQALVNNVLKRFFLNIMILK